MSKTAPTINSEYQKAIDEVLTHLRAGQAAQERADRLEGDEHTGRQAAQSHPLAGLAASTLARRWHGPPLEPIVARMEAEQKEVQR